MANIFLRDAEKELGLGQEKEEDILEEEEKEKPRITNIFQREAEKELRLVEEEEDKPKAEDSFKLDPTYAEETYKKKVIKSNM